MGDASHKAFALAICVYFPACGFLFGFLWARLYMLGEFMRASNLLRGDKLCILTSSLPDGTVNLPYKQGLNASGTAPFKWTLASGNLPDGLSLNQCGGLSGTPTAQGKFKFSLEVEDDSATKKSQELSITIG